MRRFFAWATVATALLVSTASAADNYLADPFERTTGTKQVLPNGLRNGDKIDQLTPSVVATRTNSEKAIAPYGDTATAAPSPVKDGTTVTSVIIPWEALHYSNTESPSSKAEVTGGKGASGKDGENTKAAGKQEELQQHENTDKGAALQNPIDDNVGLAAYTQKTTSAYSPETNAPYNNKPGTPLKEQPSYSYSSELPSKKTSTPSSVLHNEKSPYSEEKNVLPRETESSASYFPTDGEKHGGDVPAVGIPRRKEDTASHHDANPALPERDNWAVWQKVNHDEVGLPKESVSTPAYSEETNSPDGQVTTSPIDETQSKGKAASPSRESSATPYNEKKDFATDGVKHEHEVAGWEVGATVSSESHKNAGDGNYDAHGNGDSEKAPTPNANNEKTTQHRDSVLPGDQNDNEWSTWHKSIHDKSATTSVYSEEPGPLRSTQPKTQLADNSALSSGGKTSSTYNESANYPGRPDSPDSGKTSSLHAIKKASAPNFPTTNAAEVKHEGDVADIDVPSLKDHNESPGYSNWKESPSRANHHEDVEGGRYSGNVKHSDTKEGSLDSNNKNEVHQRHSVLSGDRDDGNWVMWQKSIDNKMGLLRQEPATASVGDKNAGYSHDEDASALTKEQARSPSREETRSSSDDKATAFDATSSIPEKLPSDGKTTNQYNKQTNLSGENSRTTPRSVIDDGVHDVDVVWANGASESPNHSSAAVPKHKSDEIGNGDDHGVGRTNGDSANAEKRSATEESKSALVGNLHDPKAAVWQQATDDKIERPAHTQKSNSPYSLEANSLHDEDARTRPDEAAGTAHKEKTITSYQNSASSLSYSTTDGRNQAFESPGYSNTKTPGGNYHDKAEDNGPDAAALGPAIPWNSGRPQLGDYDATEKTKVKPHRTEATAYAEVAGLTDATPMKTQGYGNLLGKPVPRNEHQSLFSRDLQSEERAADEQPSQQPSEYPSEQPSVQPSEKSSEQPNEQQSVPATEQPSQQPSEYPSEQPSLQPSVQPSETSSETVTEQPSEQPSVQPSEKSSEVATDQSGQQPSEQPAIEDGELMKTTVVDVRWDQDDCNPCDVPTEPPTLAPVYPYNNDDYESHLPNVTEDFKPWEEVKENESSYPSTRVPTKKSKKPHKAEFVHCMKIIGEYGQYYECENNSTEPTVTETPVPETATPTETPRTEKPNEDTTPEPYESTPHPTEPDKPTPGPGDPTPAPTDPTKPNGEPTPSPTKPVELTPAPTKPNDEPTPAPTKPGESTPAPTKVTPAPTKPGESTPAPTNLTPAPTEPGESTPAPTKLTPSPTKPGESTPAPTKSYDEPTPTPAASTTDGGTSTTYPTEMKISKTTKPATNSTSGTTTDKTATGTTAPPTSVSTGDTYANTNATDSTTTGTDAGSGNTKVTSISTGGASSGGAALGGGTIAGIVIACVVFVVIVVGAVLVRQRSIARQREENLFADLTATGGHALETDYAAM